AERGATGQAVLAPEEDEHDPSLVREVAQPDVLPLLVLEHEVGRQVADRDRRGRIAGDLPREPERDPAAEADDEDGGGGDPELPVLLAAPRQDQERRGEGEDRERPPPVAERGDAQEK